MPTKAELYAQMADKVATHLTGSWQEWAGFLTTASRPYKYPFHEQLMIYTVRRLRFSASLRMDSKISLYIIKPPE